MQRKGFQIRIWQWGLLAAIFVFWWAMTKPGFIPAFFFSDDSQAAFFFGEPVIILQRIWEWFAGGEIYSHLGVTLYETVMAFVIVTMRSRISAQAVSTKMPAITVFMSKVVSACRIR